MAAVGFRAAYADADLDALLTPEAAARIDLLESTCAGDVIAGYQDLPVPAYALDPRTTPPFTELIAENTPARVATTAPVLVAHGRVDSLVPISLSQLFFPRLCAAGNIAELRTYEGATHGSVVAAAGPDIGGWIADRLAGARAASTCAGG
jgi:acetyl esterase/lipase